MNELIHLKNKYKYKKYNRIPNVQDKTDEIIHNIINDMIDTVIKHQTNQLDFNTNVIVSPKNSPRQHTVENIQDMELHIEETECRICFEEETREHQFIWPCRCKGTSKYVHNSCLERWRYENIDNPAFEICMECRYKYKFSHRHPYEFHSQININGCFILTSVNILPLMFSFIMTQIDSVNKNIILKTIFGVDNPLIQYIDLNPETSSSISYSMYYNIVLYVQSIFCIAFYILYVCKYIYRKKQYFKFLSKDWVFYFFFLFKYPIMYQMASDDVSWLTIFITISTIYIFFEPIFYIILLKKHNAVLFKLDLDNSFFLKNYVEDDDFEYQDQRRIQNQLQLQIEEMHEEEYLSGTVVSP